MGLNIKNIETEERVRALAALTGEGLTTAIDIAVRERLERLRGQRQRRQEEVNAALQALDALPVIDDTPAGQLVDEMYDEDGLPR